MQWCLPPEADAGFAWGMEGVLAADARPEDPAGPVVCPDGSGRRLLAEVRPPLPPAPGSQASHDPEYV